MINSQEIAKKIRSLHIYAKNQVSHFFAGAYRSTFKGKGLEFEDIRNYYPGDEIRLMDWNVTARSNAPFIKVFREERELSIILIIDISASSRFSHTMQTKKDLIAEVAALISFSAIHNQDNVGLLLFSSEVELYLKPKKGNAHLMRILRELIDYQPKFEKTDLANALTFLGKLHQRRAICFLISDFISEDFSQQLKLISTKHELIAFHIFDLYEKNFKPKGMINLKDLETKEEKIVDTEDPILQLHLEENANEQFRKIQSLFQKSGIDYMAFQTEESATKKLIQFFQTRRKK